MMQRTVSLSLVIVALLFALTGCQFINQLISSNEASIVSFTMDGIVGSATIDPSNRIVMVTVEPMDISTVTPDVTVSENATLQMATLVDGQTVTFRVTAEDGTVATWSVTVNVQYGISFTYASEPTHVVLTAGVVDSSDASNDALNGSGVPAGYVYVGGPSDSTLVYAMASNYDLATAEAQPSNYATIAFEGMATGSLDATQSYFSYYRFVDGDGGDVNLDSDYTVATSYHTSVSSFGAVGSDIVGTFAGTVLDASSASHTITNGFFKVRRLSDESVVSVSSNADILSFTMDGIVGAAVIDPDSRTVVAAVEPMDISGVTPTVSVSDNATLQTATLVDGQAVTFQVTAEDGTVKDWSVTVNVQYGVSFTYASDPTHIVLTSGAIESGDPMSSAYYGDGVPPGNVITGESGDSTTAFGMAENYDFASGEAQPAEFAEIMFYGTSTGSFDATESYFMYYMYIDGAEGDILFDSSDSIPTSFQVSVSAMGAVGDDIVGTFGGDVTDSSNTPHTITNGFFKVRRIADNALNG